MECRRVCSSEKVRKREIKAKGSNPEIMKINEVWVFLKSDADMVKARKVELGTGTSHFESQVLKGCIGKRIRFEIV